MLSRIPGQIQRFIHLRGLSSSTRLLSNKNGSDDSDMEGGDDMVDKELKSAAISLSDKLHRDKSSVENDLISQLKKMQFKQQDRGESAKNKDYLSDVLSNMKIVKKGTESKGNKSRNWEEDMSGTWMEAARSSKPNFFRKSYRSVNLDQDYKLFQGKGLDIFNTEDTKSQVKHTPVKETLWDVYDREQCTIVSDAPPINAFQEMIQWTKQGKMWKFPIDNEQDWELEQNTGFHEHVFLDHLTEDFPKRGPLRHFIDLVVVALSKNAFLTAEQKREHIQWFREYFTTKQEILMETLGDDGKIGYVEQQALEAENV